MNEDQHKRAPNTGSEDTPTVEGKAMEFIYPPSLIDEVKIAWRRAEGPTRIKFIATLDSKAVDMRPFPNDEGLTHLLNTVYHASLLAEENRRLGFRVAYLPPDVAEVGLPLLQSKMEPFRLNPPRELTPAELMRLGPATDPTRALVLVADSRAFRIDYPSALTIWGILHLGSDWWELVTGRALGAIRPPDIFTVSSHGPGELVMSRSGKVLVRLRAGTLVVPPLRTLMDGPIGKFLSNAADTLYSEVCTKLGQPRYASDNPDDHPRHFYFRTLSNILLRARERAHGGSFLVIPDAQEADDPRLADRISLKYVLGGLKIWPLMVDRALAYKNLYDLLFPEDTTKVRVDDLRNERKAFYWEHTSHQVLEHEIADLESFVASLSAVDGAVVITDRLRVIGFGGEITAGSPTLSSVRIAVDEDGIAGNHRPITSFGTRHRSALRFCSSLEDAVAFVISQDGDVRGITRVGRDLVMWNDLDLREEVY